MTDKRLETLRAEVRRARSEVCALQQSHLYARGLVESGRLPVADAEAVGRLLRIATTARAEARQRVLRYRGSKPA